PRSPSKAAITTDPRVLTTHPCAFTPTPVRSHPPLCVHIRPCVFTRAPVRSHPPCAFASTPGPGVQSAVDVKPRAECGKPYYASSVPLISCQPKDLDHLESRRPAPSEL